MRDQEFVERPAPRRARGQGPDWDKLLPRLVETLTNGKAVPYPKPQLGCAPNDRANICRLAKAHGYKGHLYIQKDGSYLMWFTYE